MTDFAKLVLDTDTRGLKRGEQDLKSLSRTSTQTAKGITAAVGKIGGALAGALAVSGGIGELVRVNAEFGASMQKVAAISGATGAELESLRKAALDMGQSTKFSASQAADALGFLAMAGFEASEALEALPQVLALAAASGMELAQAADIASNVLSGFGKEAADAGEVADVLAAAASSTNTSVSQLGQAMSTVAPISAALGVSMQETAAAIGVLSDAGIQGERAGTALRGIMASLAGPTTQAQEALAKYGLTAADINPETVGLAEAMGRLEDASLSMQDAITIFGRETASGALVIAGASERVRELTGEFELADGAAKRMADTMSDSLEGDIQGLKSALEGLMIALGDAGASGEMRNAVKAATALIRATTNLVQKIDELGIQLGGATRNIDDMVRGMEIFFSWVNSAITPVANFASGIGVTSERLATLYNQVTSMLNPLSRLLDMFERIGGRANGRDAVGLGSSLPSLDSIIPRDFRTRAQSATGAVAGLGASVSSAAPSFGSMGSAASSASGSVDGLSKSLSRLDEVLARALPENPEITKYKRLLKDFETLEKAAISDEVRRAARVGLIAANDNSSREPSFREGPLEGAKAVKSATEMMGKTLEELAQDSETQAVRIERTFADMSRSIIGSLQGLTNSIRSGDILGVLGGVLDIFLQLASTGLFGDTLAKNVNRPAIAGARANGGPVTGGQTYLVGERGPELFTAPHSGQIISNDNMRQSGGGQKVVVINNSSFADVYVDGKIQQSAPAIAQGGANLANSQMSRKRTRSVR